MSNLCNELHQLCSLLQRLRFPLAEEAIPPNGVYVVFEAGEVAHGTDRIVRVGSHTGKNNLPSRLTEHFVNENKDRGVFRKNIGRALLNRDGDPFLQYWELDLTTSRSREMHRAVIDFDRQRDIERQVTRYIRSHMSFVAFEISERRERLALEKRLISLVSLCDECLPSGGLLGSHSPKPQIRHSGLWQSNELYKQPLSQDEFAGLRALVYGRGTRLSG